MDRALVDRIANAVLYEGYILYPYRPSVKNTQRWTFGGLYPETYCRTHPGSDAPSNQTECLVEGDAQTTLDVTVRFLHLTQRVAGELVPPLADWPVGPEPPCRAVETLRIGDQVFHTWQEAEERSIDVRGKSLGDIVNAPCRRPFSVPGRRWLEPLRGPGGLIEGALVRRQETIEGTVAVEATRKADCLFKISVRVFNRTPLDESQCVTRDDALLRSMVSTHAILNVHDGAFVSLLDPPEPWRVAAADCRNVGTWPILVGEEGNRDAILSSPIILYDYPRLAPESPGDLFDATEIDEILTLRILTLTDEEKIAAARPGRRRREQRFC